MSANCTSTSNNVSESTTTCKGLTCLDVDPTAVPTICDVAGQIRKDPALHCNDEFSGDYLAQEASGETFSTLHQRRVANTAMRRARDLLEACDGSADKALFVACVSGYSDVAVCLVRELGADVEAKDNGDGWTPLHIAAQNGHHRVVRLLVKELGADVKAEDRRGQNAIHRAALNGQRPIRSSRRSLQTRKTPMTRPTCKSSATRSSVSSPVFTGQRRGG